MYPLVEQWLERRENQKDFCSFHRLPLAVFAYWLRKYREEEAAGENGGERKFAALSVRQEAALGPVVEFPDGVKVQLSGTPSASYLRELAGQC